MPRGRPRLPGTAEEKAIARRKKVLQNVRAYRARQKEKYEISADYNAEAQWPIHTPDTYPDSNTERISLIDITCLSNRAPIELSFGFDFAVVHDFQNLTRRYPFMMTLEMFQTPDRIVQIATVAAAAATLSVKMGDKRLETLGRTSYNIALQSLQRRVNSLMPGQFPMLATVANCLMSYEIANGSERIQNSPWGAHALGCALFFQLAGPTAYNSESGRLLLRSHRPAIIQISAYARKPCFLDHQDWRTIPFEGETKTAEDHIWEIAACLSGHMSSVESLRRQLLQEDETAAVTTVEVLRERLAVTLGKYRGWLADFYVNPQNWPTETGLLGEWLSKYLPDNVFWTSLNFANTQVSELHMVYWSSLLNLHLLVFALYHSLRAAGLVELATTLSVLIIENPEELASNICRSMEYCIGTDESDLSGTLYAGYLPLQAATRFYKTDPQRYKSQLRWCYSLGSFISKRGLFHRDYLDNPGGEAIIKELYNFERSKQLH